MDRDDGWNPFVWFLMGLLGLSIVVRPKPQAAEAQVKPPASKPPHEETVVGSGEGADWLRGALPALRLIAEHLGVGVDAGVELAATADRVRTRDGFKEVEEALGRRPLDCSGELSSEAARVARDVQLLARIREKEGWGELVERAKANAAVVGLLCRAKHEAGRRNLQLRFVIATIPDYVDGSSAWDADQRIEAIQKGAAAAGFFSDRFYLPDSLPDNGPPQANASTHAHDLEAGALLFRKYAPPDQHKANELLVVLLATETTTLGVQRHALLAALALATAWSPAGDLSLIAPSYSGSSLSLRATLERTFERGLLLRRQPSNDWPAVRIISGSATASYNRRRLMTSVAGDVPDVTFESTTATDDDHLCALETYLSSSHEGWKDGTGIAILRESNTAYGGNLNAATRIETCPGRFPNAYVFPFPVHVSRLRAQAAADGDAEPRIPSEARVRLKLAETQSTDRVPAVAPELTSATAEVVLGNILDGIERLGIGAIGINATDKRDHLFLAEEIRRRVPSVLIFALEGNLLYLHPDYRSYMRGTLVVGSYPLFFPTQDHSKADRSRHQFASMAAAGEYNALLTLLANGPSGDEDKAILAQMLDYDDCAIDASGGGASCGPSVWIAMVGRDAFWPLHRVSRHALNAMRAGAIGRQSDEAQKKRVENLRAYSYSRPWLSGDLRTVPDSIRLPPSAAVVGFIVFVAAALLSMPWLIRRALAARWPSPSVRLGLVQVARAFDMLYPPGRDEDLPWRVFASKPLDVRLASLRREHRLGYVACAAAVLCAGFWLATALAATYLQPVPHDGWQVLEASSFVMVAILVVLAAYALWPIPGHGPSLLRRGLVAVPILTTLAAFAFAAPSPRLTGPLSAFNGQRFLTLSSLVSPTAPVGFVAAAVMAWGLWRLRQVQLQSAPLGTGSSVTDLAGGTLPSGGLVLAHELNYPYLHVGPWGLILVATVAVAQGALGWSYRHTGEGSVSFGLFLWASAILVTVLMGFTLTNAVRVGRLLLAGTGALERHPLRLAFGTLQRLGISPGYSLSPPGTEALAPLVRQVGALAGAIRKDAKRVPLTASEPEGPGRRITDGSGPPPPPPDPDCGLIAAMLRIRAGDVETVLTETKILEKLGPTAAELALPRFFHASPLWPKLEMLSDLLVRSLERGPWASNPYRPETGADGAPAAPALAFHREAEAFLALQVFCVIRLVLSRVFSGLTLVVSGFVLLLCAHLLYSFPGRPFWLAWDAALVAAATAVILWLLVSLEKDPILSRLAGTAPGTVSWTGGFSVRMVAYAMVALLSLFATFFPEVGSSIKEWLEPMRKALP